MDTISDDVSAATLAAHVLDPDDWLPEAAAVALLGASVTEMASLVTRGDITMISIAGERFYGNRTTSAISRSRRDDEEKLRTRMAVKYQAMITHILRSALVISNDPTFQPAGNATYPGPVCMATARRGDPEKVVNRGLGYHPVVCRVADLAHHAVAVDPDLAAALPSNPRLTEELVRLPGVEPVRWVMPLDRSRPSRRVANWVRVDPHVYALGGVSEAAARAMGVDLAEDTDGTLVATDPSALLGLPVVRAGEQLGGERR